MANRYSKKDDTLEENKAVETEVVQVSSNNTNENVIEHNTSIVQENEMLKQQMEEMKAQMAILMKAVSGGSDNSSVVHKERDISFVNLMPATAVLKGTYTTHKLEGQFAKRSFPEHEAKAILINTPKLISSGRIYIADKDFIRENDLTEVFARALSDVQLKGLLEKNPSDVIEIYNSVSDGQKDIIINMIIDKKQKGQFVDANILVELGKICGKDLTNIEAIENGIK